MRAIGLLIAVCFTTILAYAHPADSANKAYEAGNYEKAISLYHELENKGWDGPGLYYNLGNAYYKAGNIGLSILYYEKAKKYLPFDEDIKHNLKMANQLTLDKLEPAPVLFLSEWWLTAKSMYDEKQWSLRFIICLALVFVFIGAFLFSDQTMTKQIGFWMSVSFIGISLLTFSLAKGRSMDLRSKEYGVILSSSVEVKNAPSDNSTKLFILHEGTKVATPDSTNGWVKIEISDEKIGWVRKNNLEFI